MAHVAPHKKETVAKISKLMQEYPIIGIIDMENLPAPQLQKMREKLRGKVEIIMTKKRLMRIAFEQVKKDNIKELENYFRGMPALLFTKDNPFSLYRTIKKSQSSAPAKAGQTAPKDIEVKAGATNFAPGPIIGELGSFGMKTGVEGGKVAIKEDKVVCKEGEEISPKLAEILGRLDIKPMSVGLDLLAIYEDGTIFTKNVLDVDEGELKANFATAAQDALSLSIEIGHITTDNAPILVTKAHTQAQALSLEAAFLTKDTVETLLSKAHAQMSALKALES
ncbi:MAG: 50S ribosomal protein L10 [Candidatus Woesearchaeota archaeon]